MWRLVCLVGALWTTHAVPQGDNTCQGVIKHPVKVRVNVTEPVTYRTYTWCLRVPPRCSNYVIQMKERVKVQTEMHNRTITVCCRGYVEMDMRCVPACPPHTECPNMHCNRTNHCYCSPGYTGVFCNDPCPKGVWGADCKKECDCPAGFTCHHLTGDCMLDDKPSVRTTVRRASSEQPLVLTTVHSSIEISRSTATPASTPSTVYQTTRTVPSSPPPTLSVPREILRITPVPSPVTLTTVPSSSATVVSTTFPTPVAVYSTSVPTRPTMAETTTDAHTHWRSPSATSNHFFTTARQTITTSASTPSVTTSTPVTGTSTSSPSTERPITMTVPIQGRMFPTVPTVSTTTAPNEKTMVFSTETTHISTATPSHSTTTSTLPYEVNTATSAPFTKSAPTQKITTSTSTYTAPTTVPSTHPFTFSSPPVFKFDDVPTNVPQSIVTDSAKSTITLQDSTTQTTPTLPVTSSHPILAQSTAKEHSFKPTPRTLAFNVTSSRISIRHSTPATIITAESVNPLVSTSSKPFYFADKGTVTSSSSTYPEDKFMEIPENTPSSSLIFSSRPETGIHADSSHLMKGHSEFERVDNIERGKTTAKVIDYSLSQNVTLKVIPDELTTVRSHHLPWKPDSPLVSVPPVSKFFFSTVKRPEESLFTPDVTVSHTPVRSSDPGNNFESLSTSQIQKMITLDDLEPVTHEKKHSTLTPSSEDTYDSISPSSAPWFPEVGILRMNEDKRSSTVSPAFISSSKSSSDAASSNLHFEFTVETTNKIPTSADSTVTSPLLYSVTTSPSSIDNLLASKENSSPVPTDETKYIPTSPVPKLITPEDYEHFTINSGRENNFRTINPVPSTQVISTFTTPILSTLKPIPEEFTSTVYSEQQLEKIKVKDDSIEEPSNFLPTVQPTSRTTSLWEYLESGRLKKKEEAQSVFSYASSEPPSNEDFLNLTYILNSISDFTAFKGNGKDSEKSNRGSFKLKYTDIPPYRPQLIHGEVPRVKMVFPQNVSSEVHMEESSSHATANSVDQKLSSTNELADASNILKLSSLHTNPGFHVPLMTTEPLSPKTEASTETTDKPEHLLHSDISFLSQSTLVQGNTETSSVSVTESVSVDSVNKKPFRRKDSEADVEPSDLSYNMSVPMASREEAPASLTRQVLIFGGPVLLAGSILCGAVLFWLNCKSKKKVEDSPVAETILAYQTSNTDQFVYSVPRSPVSPEIFFCPTFTSIHADKITKELQEMNVQSKSPVEPVYAEIPF